MCGITGWIDWNRDLRSQRGIVKKMAETLNRRGPDDLNVWVREHAAFGHARLVVVDPEGGKQPMTRFRNNLPYTICYNGELYNTEDIRRELLKKGYTFHGHSDTEVLLTSYMEWKENCLQHLNGIFAFAVWDAAEDKLFIGRDRLGVKPLFYKQDGGRFLFGSELKALLAHPDVRTEITYDGLAEVFGLGPSKSPGHGIFKGIHELRPGHALTFSKNGLKTWRYWNVKSEKHTDSLEETAQKVRELFVDTVERQLVSDVPICTFLSGGVDSSAITAIAAKYMEDRGKDPLHTYSIDYVDNELYFKANDFQPNSDNEWIEKMTTAFTTKHHYKTIQTEELVQYLKDAVLVKDAPGMADVDSSLIWFCEQIKKEHTVSLSGECADEIFGGYPWFHREDDMNRNGFPWMRSTDERESLLKQEWKKRLNLNEYVLARYQETIDEMPRLDGETGIELKRRQLFYLNIIWFMTTLLDRKDRMSMGASLEVRVPFADHRLVEYVWNIPWAMKMVGNREKGILRKALEGILPNDVLYRKKSPYPKTHNPHYTKALQVWMNEILTDSNAPILEFFDRDKLKAIVDSEGAAFKIPYFGQLMTGPQLIANLAQVNYWLDKYNVKVV
ncbi:asparagine synthase (glutamine-hydrolyzing) [Bacillus sp. Marseille-P3661]|uniref:asparagine synthase (glutamine-hydrolyzing) n=1 Tax=Bacillus sp. Marseille-P3661 TaxID=1936234 RepID=UPI000C82FFF5|nr:asparagine synthase (glutamine-hydrolyzing) [Bacillus sp. Marseille-P3661]